MKITKRLIENILKEIENNLHMRGHTGYGVGHPYQKGTERRIYGKSAIEYAEEESEDLDKEDDLDDKDEMDKIKISKVFKEKKYEQPV